jgi:hypothetical protein
VTPPAPKPTAAAPKPAKLATRRRRAGLSPQELAEIKAFIEDLTGQSYREWSAPAIALLY